MTSLRTKELIEGSSLGNPPDNKKGGDAICHMPYKNPRRVGIKIADTTAAVIDRFMKEHQQAAVRGARDFAPTNDARSIIRGPLMTRNDNDEVNYYAHSFCCCCCGDPNVRFTAKVL